VEPTKLVRPDRDAYRRYLDGMDASMRQKVALTAAHLLCEGWIADLGMGSGTGSFALASLYPRLEVVGVDADATLARMAGERYRRSNLRFLVGDVARPAFLPETVDGLFNSSVLHHVTSFGGYRHQNAADALAAQVCSLRLHGTLIVRDFVDPGPGDVFIDLPADDGDDRDDPRSASSASLFRRFTREFRSLSEAPGFVCCELPAGEGPPLAEGWRRYRLAHKLAAEFLLRKDYRQDWASEVQKEYTYFTQDQFEAVFARLGMRILASTPLRNPWIVRNRLRGRARVWDLQGRPLEFPPTNFLIAGEKVPPGEGVRFRETEQRPPLGFLRLEHHRHRETGRVMDLVWRPNLTLDLLPHFEDGGETYVLARVSYPRPILCSRRAAPLLDGSRPPGYVVEPLNVLQSDRPLGQTAEEALESLAGLASTRIVGFHPGGTYYPSPGGLQEEVRSVLIEVEPVFVQRPLVAVSGFSTSGRVRAIEARQLLRAAQVGGLPDARLELNVYELLLILGRDVGPWIGERIELPEAAGAPVPSRLEDLGGRPVRRVFERVSRPNASPFLDLICAQFQELGTDGGALRSRDVEYVVPRPLSTNTVATALLFRRGDDVYLGVDDDDLPAAQAFKGNSQILVAPAWRLPHEITTLTPARDWVAERLRLEYGLRAGEWWELGGRYHPSPGATPEAVYPVAVEVRRLDPRGRRLHWLALRDLVAGRSAIVDGHLRIVALRAAHALGLLAVR
jgi:hypothetical protein